MSAAAIRRVRDARLPSPWRGAFVREGAAIEAAAATGACESAGPRDRVAYGPEARCGILTAGGLCPGINDVVRALVLTLWHGYGVRAVLGIRHGYAGLAGRSLRELDVRAVRDAHREGGTLLGTSRGHQDVAVLADSVEALALDALFCVGGDGTLKGALALDRELERRGRATAIVGIPKTIDNDIAHCSRTFGYLTAVEEATRAVAAAHAEARSHRDGVAIVQLMGRESGFIAAAASLACPDVNACLVPESRFEIGGEHGLVAFLDRRLRDRGHAVVVAAEGAGSDLWRDDEKERDASGNVKLPDIGPRLAHDVARAIPRATVKLLDPSYQIRAGLAGANDRILCAQLAQDAVHAAMSGRTRVMVALLGDDIIHVPLEDATAARKRLDLDGALWQSVLASTGQPELAGP